MGKSQSLRERIESRAGGRCEYCHAPQSACGYRFHLEHILPTVAGGADEIANRALACAACNLAKSDRTAGVDPRTGRTVALFDPRVDPWEEHFSWGEDGTVLLGLTPNGRATVETLDLNAPWRRAARRLWFGAGLLP